MRIAPPTMLARPARQVPAFLPIARPAIQMMKVTTAMMKEAVRAMVTEVAGCEVAFNQCLDAKILTTIHDKALELL